MNNGFFGFPNILGLLRATAFKAIGKAGATAGAALAGGTTSGAPTSGQFDVGDAVIAQDGQVWICTAAGTPGTWAAVSGSGGTVTSVALAGPTGTTVSGSPLVGSGGTLTLSWASQSAHALLAGPTSGGAAAPTFRTLVAADLPASAVINPMTAEGSLIQGAASGTPAELLLGTAGQVPGPVGSDVAWLTGVDQSGLADPTTADNDLIYRKKTTVTSLVIGFIGDSVTSNTPGGGSTPPASCVSDLSTDGLTVTASNQGVSGTSTSDWGPGSTNLTTAKAAFASAGVRLVHLMLGTNDARVAVRNSAATYQANLQAIVSDLVGAGYIVALSYPLYSTPGSNSGDQDATANTLRIAYQAKINQICNGWTVRQADTSAYAYFASHSSELSDGIHPTATGAADLAQLWANGLARVVGALTQQTTLQRLTLGTNLSISSGTLNAASGGYTDPLTTKGDLVARTASATTRQAVGADGLALVADSSQSTGLGWGSVAAQVSSPLVLLPNANAFVVDGTSDEQPPDFITLSSGDCIGVGGM